MSFTSPTLAPDANIVVTIAAAVISIILATLIKIWKWIYDK